MSFYTEYAQFTGDDIRRNALQAVEKLKNDFAGRDLVGIIYYAANNYDPHTLVTEMHKAFPAVRKFGCTSGGELIHGRLLNRSVAAMGFSPDAMEMVEAVGVGNIDADPKATDKALSRLEEKTGLKVRDLDLRKHVGWLLLDGLADLNDYVVERAGELSEFVFAGGCAADGERFEKTLVWVDGELYENGAVFALMQPRRKFSVFKTQSITLTDKVMTATKVDSPGRVILEFDGKPAAVAYAEAMGVRLDPMALKQGGKQVFDALKGALTVHGVAESAGGRMVTRDEFVELLAKWPLALVVGGEPFIRAATTLVDNGGIRVYMPPIEGLRYMVARTEDVVDETRRMLEEKRGELGGISAVMGAGCMLRQAQLKNENRTREFEELFADTPTLKFSSYGEIFVSVVSQSASMIVFA